MTEQRDRRGTHPSLDELADIDAGVDAEAAVDGHVSDCEQCQRGLAAIRSTRDDVSALSLPPMPLDVANRIDAALLAESGRSAPDADGAIVVPLAPRSARHRPRSWLAGGVAAAVVAALVTAITISSFGSNGHHPSATSEAGSGTNAASAAQSVVLRSGLNYTAKTFDADVATLLLREQKSTNGTVGTGGTQGAGPGAGAAGGNRSAPQPKGPLAGTTAQGHAAFSNAVPPDLAALQTDRQALSRCIATLLGAPPYLAPMAVDIASYNGKPAAIFVFPKPNNPHVVSVYVVPPSGCTTGIFQFHNVRR
ncbi:MAG: hypothetical protein ACJ735_06095 [Actinomycetes bacterium]